MNSDDDITPKQKHLKFQKKIIEVSVNKIYKDAINEWDYLYTSEEEEPTYKCICGQNIKYLNHVMNRNNKIKIIIGSECCKHINNKLLAYSLKYIDKLKRPHYYCNVCDSLKKKVRNKDKYYCKECIKKILFGKHKNNLFNYVYDNDKSYCQFVLKVEEPTGGLLLFYDYLMLITNAKSINQN
tara:strand:- start:440 stop:988 length:549 start_codon:yes stop_codon:yes gene_type:complete